MTQNQSLKEQLLKLKENGNGAISTPYDVNIFGDLTANGLSFGKITCSEDTVDYIVTAANSFDTLIDLAIGLAEALEKYRDASAFDYDRTLRGEIQFNAALSIAVAREALSEAAEKVRGIR